MGLRALLGLLTLEAVALAVAEVSPQVLLILQVVYTGTQLSTDVDKHNIVPFTECVNEIKLTLNGTHYMRWQLQLILAYSITTHKSQSMTDHNNNVYEPSKANDLLEVSHM